MIYVRWLIFAATTLALFLFLPWANKVRKWLIGVTVSGDVHLGDVVLALGTLAVAALCVVLLPRIVGRRPGRGRRIVLWVGAAVLLAGVGRSLQWAEWFHPFQYSLLSLLALWALRPHFPAVTGDEGQMLRDEGIHFVAAAVGGLLGVLDEIVQWWLPTRVFDFRDVGVNLLVVVVVQVLAWRGVEHVARGAVSRRSLVTGLRLWTLPGFLGFLCASNSPDAIALYRDFLPGGARLGKSAHTVMSVPEWIGRPALQAILAAISLGLLLLAHRLGRRLPSHLRLPPPGPSPARRPAEPGDF